ncbi:MAG: hypothetical protein ACI4DO_10450 [Roseburia sp.]
MRKLQIIFGVLAIILGIYTIVMAVLYLNRTIDNLGFCMMGMLGCLVINSINCVILCINGKKDKSEQK